MGTSDEPDDRGRDVVDAGELLDRLRTASRGLHSGTDLQGALGQLFRVVASDTLVERVFLALEEEGRPRFVTADPADGLGLDAHPEIRDLVLDVRDRAEPVRRDGSAPGDSHRTRPAPGPSRFGVPVFSEGRTVGALVGEGGGRGGLGASDEVALETIAVLLSPLLLAQRQLETTREIERLRSDFISRISHELRTPLTIITGFAGTMGAHEETLTDELRHEMLDRIVTAAARLEHLLEEVLSLASVEAGLREPQLRLVPVRDVIDLAVHDQGGTGRVEVRDDGPPRLVTDPGVARLVLGPLLENALQHGQRVSVTAEAIERGARIAVEDDGPGVPPELGPRVFERFVRGDDRSPGMGLGLAIARRVGETIGARIWHEHVPSGARFVVEVPDLTDLRAEPHGGRPVPQSP